MKIMILKIARNTSEKQLKDLFEEYGTVTSCDLVLDKTTKKSKGFGFVEMEDEKEAEAAIKALNNKQVDNNKIRVKKATDNS